MEINRDLVGEAVLRAGVGPIASEAAGPLLDAWMESMDRWADTFHGTLAVEVPFYIQVEPKTYIVGQMDRIAHDGSDVLLSEWKTKRAPRYKRDGGAYKGDSEEEWLEEIGRGPQLATYALAARDGLFLTGDEDMSLGLDAPRLLVRAVLKSTPPTFWPTDTDKGIFTFSPRMLDSTRFAYIAKASAIRAMRQRAVVPWQLVGHHCEQYGRMCQHYEERCSKHTYPPITPVGWAHPRDISPDPGFRVCQLLKLDIRDPELVVLSQSAYQTYSTCAEKGRVSQSGHVQAETSFELELGSATHAGLAALYAQLTTKAQLPPDTNATAVLI